MYSYKKSERLKSRKLIDFLFNKGKVIFEFPIKTVWVYSNLDTNSAVQIGFTVSKRNHKRAVDRNRIKRLMREAYRLNKLQLVNKAADLNLKLAVMLIYTGKNLTSFKEIEDKIIVILDRLLTELK